MPILKWEQVEENYLQLSFGDWQPMIEFVREVASSEYAEHIYPVTSMFTLKIFQDPDFYPNPGDCISVEYRPEELIFEFRVTFREEAYALNDPWTRRCVIGEAYPLFKRIIQDLKWFVEYK